MRPKTPLDWQFAYCQSRLYAQHMIEEYGAARIADMLEAYRKNVPTNAAIPKVFGVSVEEFEKGYREFLKKIVEEELGGSAVASPLSLPELEKAYEADDENPAKIAAFADGLFKARRRTQARELAEKARELNAKEPLAAVVLAELELLGRDLEGLQVSWKRLSTKRSRTKKYWERSPKFASCRAISRRRTAVRARPGKAGDWQKLEAGGWRVDEGARCGLCETWG